MAIDLVGLAALRRALDARPIVARGDLADRDIVAGAEIVADEILEDDAHVAAQRVEIVFAQVVAIEQDAAFDRIVEPGEKLHQGGLAGAVLADQCEHLAGVKRKAEMAHRPSLGAGIAEPDVLEIEAVHESDWETVAGCAGDRISGLTSKNENRSLR